MREERSKPMGMNVGSASIVMIFAVLCLTVFSVLALVTANRDWQLAEKSAAAVTNYYAADGLAEERYRQISALWQKGCTIAELQQLDVEVTLTGEQCHTEYVIPIDAQQQLRVRLLLTAGSAPQIVQWQAEANKPWSYDDHIEVWDGE